jgi:hypothetical protein
MSSGAAKSAGTLAHGSKYFRIQGSGGGGLEDVLASSETTPRAPFNGILKLATILQMPVPLPRLLDA